MAHLVETPACDPDVVTLEREPERGQRPGREPGEHVAGGREGASIPRAEKTGVVRLPLDDAPETRAEPREGLVGPVFELQQRTRGVSYSKSTTAPRGVGWDVDATRTRAAAFPRTVGKG